MGLLSSLVRRSLRHRHGAEAMDYYFEPKGIGREGQRLFNRAQDNFRMPPQYADGAGAWPRETRSIGNDIFDPQQREFLRREIDPSPLEIQRDLQRGIEAGNQPSATEAFRQIYGREPANDLEWRRFIEQVRATLRQMRPDGRPWE